MDFYHHPHTFILESGAVLPSLTIAYCTYGTLNSYQPMQMWQVGGQA
jgi:homoserine O-acetyltransferase/O-succinyltransferase